jgi:hypothetical protein
MSDDEEFVAIDRISPTLSWLVDRLFEGMTDEQALEALKEISYVDENGIRQFNEGEPA